MTKSTRSAERAGRGAAQRRRRSAEATRRAILDAAERRLRAAGPDAIRLQDIATDVGVSHPAILHHFGSREGLMGAVVARALEPLERDVVARLRDSASDVDGEALLELVFEILGDRGQARLAAWLVLTGRGGPRAAAGAEVIRAIADAAHARRQGGPARGAPFEDTLFTMLLVAATLFGDAILGPQLRASAGLGGDRDAARRFRVWLARLVGDHLSRVPAAAPRPARAKPRKP